jgi:hypothetical protein
MNRQCWKLVYIFRLKAYQRRSWRVQSRGTGRIGGGRHRRHPQVHQGGALVAANGLLCLRQGQRHSYWSLFSQAPSLWGYLHSHSMFGWAYIAMHLCLQVCWWVMNEWRGASNINFGLLKDEILLPTTCGITLKLFLAIWIPSLNKKDNLESDQGVRFL